MTASTKNTRSILQRSPIYRYLFFWWSVGCLLLADTGTTTTARENDQKDVLLLNEAGVPLQVYWVHPQTRQLSLMTANGPCQPGGSVPLQSFAHHEFEVHEIGSCDQTQDQTCRRAIFQVSPHDDQKVFLTPSFEIIHEDAKSKAQAAAGDLIQNCQNRAKRLVTPGGEDNNNVMQILMNCVQEGVATNLERSNEELAFQASVRRDMAAKLENYTCEDPYLPTSEPAYNATWTSDKDGKPRKVMVMHDRPASQIHVVEHFIADEECDAMERAAQPILHRATVADGSGGSKYSENRKAMQAGIKVPWDKEADGDAIARLSRRVYDYTNHVLGLDIKEFGQEDLMSIQYFGRGLNDTEPDRYTPHCDGDCTGMPHKYGTRMATMVMYCKIPTIGGHTNFRNAGVHVRPQSGNAIFFSYIDPKTNTTDNGFTEHSGCPVFEGEKKIVTQWIRYGVDAENPWDSFNTLGMKKTEAEEFS